MEDKEEFGRGGKGVVGKINNVVKLHFYCGNMSHSSVCDSRADFGSESLHVGGGSR